MRRILACAACLVLLIMLGVNVYAAGSAAITFSASSASVYRGDTVTITVSLSNSNAITDGAIKFSYDSNVFEFVKGDRLIGELGEVKASGGNFMYSGSAVASGKVFTFVLRVKDTAPFGSYTISGSANLNNLNEQITCSISTAKVTVACKHAYGTPAKSSDAEHTSTCTHCGDKKTEAHSWQDVNVIQGATCKDTGSKNVKCTGCGHTTTQTIPVNEDHSYSGWSKVNGSTHTRTCSVCQKVDNASHDWNGGKVTKEATCTETGSLLRTCNGCGTTREDTIPVAEHTYGSFTRVDDKTHTHTCTVCQFVETLDHTFESGWQNDADAHYLVCDGCGEKKDRSVHIPGAAATDTTPQLCTVCQRVLMPELSHEHTFETAWASDETAHWHSCTSCIITDSWQEHSYADVCAAACSVCGAQRQAPHEPAKELSADATGHWYGCGLCQEKLEFAEHTPGPAATATSAQFCTVCQFEIAPVLPHDPVYDAGTTLHWHECACGERVEAPVEACEICAAAGVYKQEFPWWLLCIAEAVVLGGVILFLLLRMNKIRKEAIQNSWKEN